MSAENNKRMHHRVFPIPEQELSIALGGSGIDGRVIDASFGGMAVFVSGQSTPFCAAGAEIPLQLRSPYLEAPLALRAVVHYARQLERGYLYGLGLLQLAAAWESFPVEVQRFFNRRASQRVEPAQPIDAEVVSGEERFDAIVRDLSAEGMAVLVRSEFSPGLRAGTEVDVTFRLPVATQQLAFRAVVAQTHKDDNLLRCGLLFDTDATERYEEQRALVVSHIAEQLGQTDWNAILQQIAMPLR